MKKLTGIISSILRITGLFIFFSGDSDYSKKKLTKVLNREPLHKSIIYFLILLFIFLLLSVTIGSLAYQKISRNPTTFNVSAVTEIVKTTTHDVPMSAWPVKDIQLSKNCPDEKEDIRYTQFTGSIQIKPFVQIRFTRIALGDLNVTLRSNNGESAGDLYDDEDEYVDSLASCAYFHIKDITKRINLGESIVLPITGHIIAGNEIKFLTQNKTPVLRTAQVSILDRSIITGENYSVGPFALETGDSFKVQQPGSPGQGFILINENAAIRLVYRAEGFRGTIKRYRSEDYNLRNSYWSMLYNDAALSLAWVVIIVLFNIIRVYLRFLVN